MKRLYTYVGTDEPVGVVACDFSQDPITDCILEGNARGAEILLRHGFDPNSRGPEAASNLALSIRLKKTDIFKLLLRYSADVNSVESDREVPLHLVVKYLNVNCLKRLLKRGAIVNVENIYGLTPLDLAVIYSKLDFVQALLAPPNYFNVDAKIYYHTLIRSSTMPQIVDELLNYGCSANEEQVRDPRFLCMAVFCNHISLVKSLLLLGAEVNCRYKNCAPLEIACSFGDYDMLLLLIRHGAEFINNSAPLFYAINNDHPMIVKELLRLGSPIFITMYFDAIIAGSLDALEVLLNFGTTRFNVNSYFEGITLIHFAVLCNRPEAIRLLVLSGGDINLSTERGYSALQIACITGSANCIHTIICLGGNIYLTDYGGRLIPLELLKESEQLTNIIKLKIAMDRELGKHTIDIDVSTWSEDYLEQIHDCCCCTRMIMISGTNISYFTLLTCSEREMANYLNNQSVLAFFKSGMYNIFSHGRFLKWPFVMGYIRMKYINTFLSFVVPTTSYLSSLPSVCINKILDYISTEEIGIMAGMIQKRMACPGYKIPSTYNTKPFEQISVNSFLVTLPITIRNNVTFISYIFP